MSEALKVFAVAIALSLDVFAVSVGVGMRGIPTSVKLRMGLAFAGSEIAMNLLGAAIGLGVGHIFGAAAGYFGFAVLVALGAYMMRESRTQLSGSARFDLSHGWGLAVAAFSLSLDSLGVGFSILYIGVPAVVSLSAIGFVSVCSTAAGLALGGRIGRFAERHAAFLGGLLLAVTGIGFILLKALAGT